MELKYDLRREKEERTPNRECGCQSALTGVNAVVVKRKMTESDYELECMRAELLGVEKPSRDEFFSRKREVSEVEEEEAAEPENLSSDLTQELDQQGEGINRASGGLDELNSILAVTQKRINHLKTVCGSFTKILKLQSTSTKEPKNDIDSGNDEKLSSGTELPQSDSSGEATEGGKESIAAEAKRPIRGDIQSAVSSQLSKLDSLISKAERADISLASQNKQVKKFLN